MSILAKISHLILFLTFANVHFGTVVALSAVRHQNYTYLISGGYRPPRDTLAKHIVSIHFRYDHKYFGEGHACAGTIIGSHTILTAAHCVQRGKVKNQAYSIQVVAKAPNRVVKRTFTRVLDVQKIIPHPAYNSNCHINDVAIIVVKEPIKEDNKYAERIFLPESPPIPGTKCTAIGWGRIFYYGPMAAKPIYVDLEILNFEECKKRYPVVHAGMLCASDVMDKFKDTCQGDSGGPLICGNRVAGIVSFGYECELGSPGFYTDVWHFREWIYANNAPALFCTFKVMLLALLVDFLLNKYIYYMHL